MLEAIKSNPSKSERRKREAEEMNDWSDLADVIEEIIRFLLDGKNFAIW